MRHALTAGEWRHAGALAATVAGLHVLGFALLAASARGGGGAAGGTLALGSGVTAYTLGLRHAFDADHIAAIDNCTRRLLGTRRQRPMSTGLFFSLGHSTVVLALVLALALGLRALHGPVLEADSTLHSVSAIVGTSVSSGFLLAIAGMNIAVLVGIRRSIGKLHEGSAEAAGAAALGGGPLSRILGRFTGAVARPWHLYPVGLLFGLGFDTASEVGLLALAAGAGAAGVSWTAIACLPILFAAGMSLLDTIDGAFMSFAYGWALSKPARKLYYNVTVTALSIAAALFIGIVQVAGLLSERWGIGGAPARWLAAIDLNRAGLVIAGIFALGWIVALATWKLARIEQRWAPAGSAPQSAR